MEHLYAPLKLTLDLPKELAEKLERRGLLYRQNDFSGELCIVSYVDCPDLADLVIKLLLKK